MHRVLGHRACDDNKQMPLPGTMGAPVYGGADVTKFIQAYKSLLSHTGTDLAAEDVIATILYYCPHKIQEMLKMVHGGLRKDSEQWQNQLKEAFGHADSWVHLYTRSHLEQLFNEQLDREKVGQKAFILAYNTVSRIPITQGALALYSQVEMLFGAVPRDMIS